MHYYVDDSEKGIYEKKLISKKKPNFRIFQLINPTPWKCTKKFPSYFLNIRYPIPSSKDSPVLENNAEIITYI